jgi:hypothetical protein
MMTIAADSGAQVAQDRKDTAVIAYVGAIGCDGRCQWWPLWCASWWRSSTSGVALAVRAAELGASVHMPRIGCGLAGGRWERIEPLITRRLSEHGIAVTVYDHDPG